VIKGLIPRATARQTNRYHRISEEGHPPPSQKERGFYAMKR
jgi:hypothetical protein